MRDGRHFFQSDYLDEKELEQISYMYDSLKDYETSIESNFDYWKDIIKEENLQRFKEKKRTNFKCIRNN